MNACADSHARTSWLAASAAALAFVLAGMFPVNNADTFGHLAQGRQIAELGRVPRVDTLSFWKPEPQPWNNYEWLSDWLGWQLFSLGGADALLALKCALLATSAALLVLLAHKLAGSRAAVLASLLLIGAIPASRFRFTERPHLVALPLVAIYLLGLARLTSSAPAPSRRARLAWTAGLAALHVLWLNVHGSHLLGLAVTGCFVVASAASRSGPALRASVIVLGLQALACGVSPYGFAILSDAIEHVANPAYRELVTEWVPWKPTDPLWLLTAPVLHALLLLASARTLVQRGITERAWLLLATLLTVACLRSIRFTAEQLVLSAPLLAIALAPRLDELGLRAARAVAAVALALLSLLVPLGAASLPPRAPLGHGLSTRDLPDASARWLLAHARAPRVLANADDAWYLMFAVPEARFLLDGRIPFFGVEHVQRMRLAFGDAERFDRVLRDFDVDTVVLQHGSRDHAAPLAALNARADWALVMVEDAHALFVRADVPLRDGTLPVALPLRGGYDPRFVLDASAAQRENIASALQRLPHHANTRGYRGFVDGLLALAPALRPGTGNGVEPPRDAAERERLREAEAQLTRAAEGAPSVPVVHAYHAQVAVALCDLDATERALELAAREGESRETLLVTQELLLRRGETERVRDFLDQAERMPAAADDGWLRALRAELSDGVRCPRN